MIFVTGASGNLGGAVIDHLLKQLPAHQISGLCRSINKSNVLAAKGINVVVGDYADKPSILKALTGVQKLLLITSNGENAFLEHKNVIDAAKEAGVKHIFYTGGALNKNVETSKLGPLWDAYVATENYIIQSGLVYTVFQNGLYAETIPFFVGERIFENGIYFPAGEGKASFAKRSEMGEAIANVLISEGHENKTYLTTGEATYSFDDIAKVISALTNREVSYFSPDPIEYELTLRKQGVNEGDIWYLTLLAAITKNNEYNIAESDLAQLLGRKPVDLKGYLKELYC